MRARGRKNFGKLFSPLNPFLRLISCRCIGALTGIANATPISPSSSPFCSHYQNPKKKLSRTSNLALSSIWRKNNFTSIHEIFYAFSDHAPRRLTSVDCEGSSSRRTREGPESGGKRRGKSPKVHFTAVAMVKIFRRADVGTGVSHASGNRSLPLHRMRIQNILLREKRRERQKKIEYPFPFLDHP